MFEIDHLDFLGNKGFDEILEKLLSGARFERGDDIPGVRVYIPRKDDTSTERNTVEHPTPSWCKEAVSAKPVPEPVEFPRDPSTKVEPKSILEMLEDGDERLEKLLGKIIDKKLAERKLVVNDGDDEEPQEKAPKKDPMVFIANRLTFLIQTLQPIVFDTSSIETGENSMVIAIDERKTFPKIATDDELGYLTCKINASPVITQEIENYLADTPYSNIYAFPVRIVNRNDDEVWGIKFVIYPKKAE